MAAILRPMEAQDRPRTSSPLTMLVLLVAVGVLFWSLFRQRTPDLHEGDARPRTVAARGNLTELETSTIDLFGTASPSVVHVANVRFMQNRWTRNVFKMPRGTGSGFVWDARGYVVTNEHVVRGGDEFVVTLADNTSLEAFLVGVDPDHDLAVLRVESPPNGGLPPLAIGTSGDLRVGQSVFAIGNPFGLDQTLTTGVISGLDREIRTDTERRIDGVIQTDAAINPGNSGGPLLDSAGRVIGINTAIAGQTGQSSGVGFAVPIDTVNRLVPLLIRGEKPRRPGLGVTLLSPVWLARARIEGVGVERVLPDSAAEEAGLRGLERDERTRRWKLGDIIVSVDGTPVKSRADLFDALDAHAVGDTVQLTVRRPDGEHTLEVELQGVAR